MTKYVVLYNKKVGGADYYEQNIVGFYDTEEAANEKAIEKHAQIPAECRSDYSVEVGIISEDQLEEKGNWESFKEVDILWEVEASK